MSYVLAGYIHSFNKYSLMFFFLGIGDTRMNDNLTQFTVEQEGKE